ncbi:hypothetical protein [Algisphaera agarilytica]|uniref:Uncharacterized protein n=1 Tax=Algisphaera agarilytica TaxID=1385975 RepID=A0A7X0H5J4_9BACT|nr:hypothetical protein [Algisphaera agarilytica]MBB6429457.1 hypothetical protein [Algisphaera agarilytica]
MMEAVLVLPLILFVLSLVIYFGFAMERMQRGMMIDRYEAWRGSAKAPGPATGLTASASTEQLRDTFFPGDNPSLRFEPSDYFPIEPSDDLQIAASGRSTGAGELANQFFQEYPRGRSMRFFVSSPDGPAMWERLFPGSIRHRHTVMDTDWRFMNFVIEDEEWYDDRSGEYRPIRDSSRNTSGGSFVTIPSQSPSTAVREIFYSDYDRRLDPLSNGNPLAERLQDFYLTYPQYWGPLIEPVLIRDEPW